MRIASPTNDNPISTNLNYCINNYYVVPDNYNFSGNNAYDVTEVSTLYNFYSINQFDYILFRDSCKNNLVPNWSGLTTDDQKMLVIHSIYPITFQQSDIDSIFTTDEQLS